MKYSILMSSHREHGIHCFREHRIHWRFEKKNTLLVWLFNLCCLFYGFIMERSICAIIYHKSLLSIKSTIHRCLPYIAFLLLLHLVITSFLVTHRFSLHIVFRYNESLLLYTVHRYLPSIVICHLKSMIKLFQKLLDKVE